MKVVNLTPHDVNICNENGEVIGTYKASGVVARLSHGWNTVDYINGIPLVVREIGRVAGLPRPQEGTVYIVSNIILDYCTDRIDLIAPVKQVKVNGKVIGCQAFVSNR